MAHGRSAGCFDAWADGKGDLQWSSLLEGLVDLADSAFDGVARHPINGPLAHEQMDADRVDGRGNPRVREPRLV